MVVYLLLTIVLIVAAAFLQPSLDRWRRLPPGPLRLPILGSMLQLLKQHPTFSHLRLAGLAKKYGGIMSIGYGIHYAVVVSSYEIAKDPYRHQETNLQRFPFEFMAQRNFRKNLGIVWGEGNIWREQRKYTLRLLRQFGFGKKETMEKTLEVEINDLVEDIWQEAKTSGGIWAVNAKRLSACQINILWSTVAGYRFDPKSPELNRHLELNTESNDLIGSGNPLFAFPFLKIFPNLSGYNRQQDMFKYLQVFMKEMIDNARHRRVGHVEPQSFLEFYLDEIDANNNAQSLASEEQLQIILMDLFQTGSDTVSTSVNWLLLYVALNENVQVNVRAEISESCPEESTTSTGMVIMPYTHATILETLRLSCVVSTPTPRSVLKDIECFGYKIPEGTCTFYNLYPMFHNQEFWGDPEVFRPERFLKPDGTLNPEKTERMIHFGLGARACLGEAMATLALHKIVIGLLRNFSFSIIDENRPPTTMPGKQSIILRPTPFSLRVKIL